MDPKEELGPEKAYSNGQLKVIADDSLTDVVQSGQCQFVVFSARVKLGIQGAKWVNSARPALEISAQAVDRKIISLGGPVGAFQLGIFSSRHSLSQSLEERLLAALDQVNA